MFTKSNTNHFNIGCAEVFVAQFDGAAEVKPVEPLIRQRLIEQTTDPQLKRQRYCVWLLLDYALRSTVGKGVDELSFDLDGNGKWICDGGVCFSLSHSEDVVAVAVSDRNVGIDVEALDESRFNARLARRILTSSESVAFGELPVRQQSQWLAEAWAKKESLFKRDGGNAFAPNAVDSTVCNNVCCRVVSFGKRRYVVAVAN